jgi:Zn-dependent peptidase ImmA (M78 family)/DNA-binding XRE family transcriptional regulator
MLCRPNIVMTPIFHWINAAIRTASGILAPMFINGDRVKQAREIRALTQTRLASLVGVTQAAIAQIEIGTFLASDDLASAIAKHTGQPITFFTQKSAPEFPLGSLLFRSHASMTKKEMVSASRYAEQVYEIRSRLSRLTKSIPVKIPLLDATSPAMAANEVRRHFSLNVRDPVPHLLNLLEWNGVVVLSIPNNKTREAFSFWFNDFPIIAIARDSPGDRSRLSVAHELGHLVLHANQPRLNVDDTEADDFAAQFLMPEVAMKEEIRCPVTLSSLAALKPKWKVSIQALIRRARDISVLTTRQYRYLFEQLSSMGWRKSEPVIIEPEKPRALRQMAEIVYGEEIDIERMAADSNISAPSLRELLDGYAAKRVDGPKIPSNLVTMGRRKG